MNIVTVANCPAQESLGSGYVIARFTAGLRLLGHRVLLYDGRRATLFPRWRRARSLRVAAGMLWAACKGLVQGTCDVLEFYGGEAWLAIAILSRWPGRRFLLVAHSNGLEPAYRESLLEHLGSTQSDGRPDRAWQRSLARWIDAGFRQVDGIVTVSRRDRNFAVERRFQRQERVLAIENALPEEFLNMAPNFARPQRIGFCGSWLENKGTTTMQADLSRILKEFPQARFSLAGVRDHFERDAMFERAVSERVEVQPFIEDKAQLRAWYATLSMLILPSFYESFGLVVAEAMACGCAVVASRVGFAASLQHGVEAWLLDSPRSPHLYAAVASLLRDDTQREAIARKGWERVQSLRWSDAVRTLDRTYAQWREELLSSQP